MLNSKPHVTIAILNWNGAAFLEKFLPFFLKTTWENFTIVIIDNASTDNSLEIVTTISSQIKWIQLDKNYGFTGGYNRGLKQLPVDGLWAIVNSDIEVSPTWLEPLINEFTQNQSLATTQPLILDYKDKTRYEYAGAAGGFMDAYGYPFCRGRIFDTVEKINPEYNQSIPLFWSSGACMMIKPALFWEAGGFDERFFAHMEEIDLCWRLQNLGYTHYVVPNSVVYHVGGGTLDYTNPRKTYLNFRNNTLTLLKNLHPDDKGRVFSTRIVKDLIAIMQFIVKGEFKFAKAVLDGISDAHKLNRESPKVTIPPKKLTELDGVFHKSLVWQYFFRNKKMFKDLFS